LENVDNRFQLVHLAARRVRQLRQGSKVMSNRDNKDVVLALREIADGSISLKNVDQYEPKPKEEMELVEVLEDDAPVVSAT
jgi:DNA-directed RNA polymerase subunit omega